MKLALAKSTCFSSPPRVPPSFKYSASIVSMLHPRSKAPRAAIAASSVSCGAKPTKISFVPGRRPGFIIDERHRSIGVEFDPVRAGGEREGGTIIKRDAEFALAFGFDHLDLIAASCLETEIEIDGFFKPRPLQRGEIGV